MHPASPAGRSSIRVSVAAFVWALSAACVNVGGLAGRATEDWTKSYPLGPGGEVHIVNTNGRVEVEGLDGSTVEIHATKIARAATDAGARELLPRIVIHEDATPSRVSVETQRIAGFMIGAGFEVQYRVSAPRGATIDVRTTNGPIALSGLSGRVTARSTNGGVSAKEATGAVDARTTNGPVNVDLSSLGSEKIALETTNGSVTLAVPDSAKADVVATWTNGGFSVSGLAFEDSNRSRRRFDGRLNGGGTPIELHTTNGGIRMRARETDHEEGKGDLDDRTHKRELQRLNHKG